MIEKIVLGVSARDFSGKKCVSVPSRIQKRNELKKKQVNNAINTYARGCRPEDIVILCDTSMMGNGKDGILFSVDGFYSKDLNFLQKNNPVSMPVLYKDLDHVELGERDDDICFVYRDGHSQTGYGSVYTQFIMAAVRRLVTCARLEEQDQQKSMEESYEQSITGHHPEKTIFKEAEPLQETCSEVELSQENCKETEPLQETYTEVESSQETYGKDVSLQPENMVGIEKTLSEEEMQQEFDRAMAIYKDGNLEQAFEIWMCLAKQGMLRGMNAVAVCYDKGEGVAKDLSAAEEWYQKAAGGGLVKAMFNLALFYKQNFEGQEKYALVYDWYERAADQGHVKASLYIGEAYHFGEERPQNIEKAAKYYQQAADGGNDTAKAYLGLMYVYGNGVQKDEKKGFEFIRETAENGNTYSIYNLACCYANGQGVEQNVEEALVWAKKAQEEDYPDATEAVQILEKELQKRKEQAVRVREEEERQKKEREKRDKAEKERERFEQQGETLLAWQIQSGEYVIDANDGEKYLVLLNHFERVKVNLNGESRLVCYSLKNNAYRTFKVNKYEKIQAYPCEIRILQYRYESGNLCFFLDPMTNKETKICADVIREQYPELEVDELIVAYVFHGKVVYIRPFWIKLMQVTSIESDTSESFITISPSRLVEDGVWIELNYGFDILVSRRGWLQKGIQIEITRDWEPDYDAYGNFLVIPGFDS